MGCPDFLPSNGPSDPAVALSLCAAKSPGSQVTVIVLYILAVICAGVQAVKDKAPGWVAVALIAFALLLPLL